MPLEPTSPAFTHEGEIPARISDLRAVLESFEGMDSKVLDEVPAQGTEDAEAEPKEEPEEESVDDFSESSDPVRLYLKELGRFQLLTREGEVTLAKRIEALGGRVKLRVITWDPSIDSEGGQLCLQSFATIISKRRTVHRSTKWFARTLCPS